MHQNRERDKTGYKKQRCLSEFRSGEISISVFVSLQPVGGVV